jgi:tocopherol cyclase
MRLRLYHPEVFQGNLKKKHYFEGWYFKHVSQDLQHTCSFIPGISLVDKDPHAFIQILNGYTGDTHYVRYPLNEFLWSRNMLYLKIGESVFTEKQIILKIEDKNLILSGQIEYQNIIRYPKSLLSPGIMGWYSFVPFMECKHGIVSVNHELKGEIFINGEIIDFNNGKGYIEKDWGVSFPEAWLWIQSNNFDEKDTSFSFSIAKIPWLGKFFVGFIAFLYLNKKFYLFSTYNNSIVSEIKHDPGKIEIAVKNKNNILKIRITVKSFGDLKAPALGEMSRRIKESIDSEVHLQLFDKHNCQLYEGTGKKAGLEVIEKIFDYIKL